MLFRSSVMIIRVAQEEQDMIWYVYDKNVNNAKLLNFLDSENTWLIHNKQSSIIITELVENNGFLICKTGTDLLSYNFTILGQARDCKVPNENNILNNCYYNLKAKLQVVEIKKPNSIIFIAIMSGIILLIVIVLVVISIFYPKLKKVRTDIDLITTRLNITTEENKTRTE